MKDADDDYDFDDYDNQDGNIGDTNGVNTNSISIAQQESEEGMMLESHLYPRLLWGSCDVISVTLITFWILADKGW